MSNKLTNITIIRIAWKPTRKLTVRNLTVGGGMAGDGGGSGHGECEEVGGKMT